ncbi:MAG TPA: cytochrome c biogenesis protein CcdA [Egibacteraceae bacterium]|jgi:cytochrome c-type biogenesis protein|nr:cytochrome c biogenesis protein CcdA [Egibacteraceae bacterium]
MIECANAVCALVTDANVLLAAAVAFAAGVVSFASPCVVPLVPGYLSYMTGLSGAELATGQGHNRLRVLGGGLLFTLGFAVPFTLLGLVGATLAVTLQHRPWQIAMGVLVAILGLAFTGLLPFDLLERERRISDVAIDRGMLGAMPLGFVFGVGWVPCVGPALGAILTLGAATTAAGGTPVRGAVLAFVYALGLGLPFVLFGLAFHHAGGALGFLRRNARAFQVGGGLMLTAVGVAIATGLWDLFIDALRPMIQGFEPPI